MLNHKSPKGRRDNVDLPNNLRGSNNDATGTNNDHHNTTVGLAEVRPGFCVGCYSCVTPCGRVNSKLERSRYEIEIR